MKTMMSHAAPQYKHLLICYHSMTGANEQLARAVSDGGRNEPLVRTVVKQASDTCPEDFLHADGYVFVSPEYLAGMAGRMKDLFDRCYYPVYGRIEGRPYAIAVCAGNDGSGAVRQIQRIVTGWRLREICPPLLIRIDTQTPESILKGKTLGPEELNRGHALGSAFAAGLALGIY